MSSSTLTRMARAALVAAACLGLSACGGKVSKGNYEKIRSGMDEQEVLTMLGESKPLDDVKLPSVSESHGMGLLQGRNTRRRAWQEGDRVIMVDFRNGKVIDKRASGL